MDLIAEKTKRIEKLDRAESLRKTISRVRAIMRKPHQYNANPSFKEHPIHYTLLGISSREPISRLGIS
jgi:hypothetical protein